MSAVNSSPANYSLILANPRSCSTAFTRALCKSTGKTGIHESLYADSPLICEGEIYKEMFSDISSSFYRKRIYFEEIKNNILHAKQPIILLTAHPADIFYSLLKVTFIQNYSTFRLDDNQDIRDIKNLLNDLCFELKESTDGQAQVTNFCSEAEIPTIAITKAEILNDPGATVNKVLSAWGEAPLDPPETEPLLAEMKDHNERYEAGKYHLAWRDTYTPCKNKPNERLRQRKRDFPPEQAEKVFQKKIRRFFQERFLPKLKEKKHKKDFERFIEQEIMKKIERLSNPEKTSKIQRWKQYIYDLLSARP